LGVGGGEVEDGVKTGGFCGGAAGLGGFEAKEK